MTIPWYVYPLLLTPRRIAANLERVHAAGLVPDPVGRCHCLSGTGFGGEFCPLHRG